MADEETVSDWRILETRPEICQLVLDQLYDIIKLIMKGIQLSSVVMEILSNNIDNSSKDESLSLIQQKKISSENVDINVDYQGWLEIKKRKWKSILEKRKKVKVKFSLQS
ncbi:hypothetical protein S83_070461 [Arachis hypogaea]|nr:DNA polymerase epsilon catalytic subunit A [Arachis hypogaea]